MALDATTAPHDDEMDMPAHEATYAGFVKLTEISVLVLVSIVLLLVLWGIQGHGFVALVGLVLTIVAGAVGGMTGLGWKAVAPVFALLGLACIVL